MITIEEFTKDWKHDVKNLGFVPNKTLTKILKRYKYIDVTEYWYDDPEHPDRNTWIDIEGMGYGWLWCNYKKERSDRKLRKRLRQFGLEMHGKNDVWTSSFNNIKNYIFCLQKSIVIISLSNQELSPL